MQRDAFFDVPQLASMAATPKFFFRDAHELLSSDGDALSDIGSPSSVTTSPWLLDDEDDELLDTLLLPAELNEDVLRRILVFCQASTLREVKAVDRRTHRIVAELLRDPRRFPRLLFSSLANGGAARRAAHRELPARWGKAIIGATSAAAVVSLRASTDVTTGAGAVRLRLTARPTADVGLERTCFSRSSAATGWVTCLVDRWVSREVFTCTMHIEQLGGEACIGVVGRNFADPSGCSPLRSRHAVMIEGRSGKVYVKGRATGLALPVTRRPCRGAPRSQSGPTDGALRAGSSLQLVINMTLREMHVHILTRGGAPEASVEVEGLPADVAVAVSLGPSADLAMSTVRLESSSTERSASHRYEGKTIVDEWDEDHFAGRDLRSRLVSSLR